MSYTGYPAQINYDLVLQYIAFQNGLSNFIYTTPVDPSDQAEFDAIDWTINLPFPKPLWATILADKQVAWDYALANGLIDLTTNVYLDRRFKDFLTYFASFEPLKADLMSGKVPASQLPSYVDDVIEVANLAALPSPGETGKLYTTLNDNKLHRWTGSTYVDITAAGNTPASTPVTLTMGGAGVQPQVSARPNLIIIPLSEAQTISLITGQAGSISFQTSATLGGTYTEFSRIGNSNSGSLTIGLNLTDTNTQCLIGFVPAGSFYKIVSAGTGTNAGIGTAGAFKAQEIAL